MSASVEITRVPMSDVLAKFPEQVKAYEAWRARFREEGERYHTTFYHVKCADCEFYFAQLIFNVLPITYVF